MECIFGTEGMPTDCFWVDAPYTKGGATDCKHYTLLHGIQCQHEVMLPVVAPPCVDVFQIISMTTGSCNAYRRGIARTSIQCCRTSSWFSLLLSYLWLSLRSLVFSVLIG